MSFDKKRKIKEKRRLRCTRSPIQNDMAVALGNSVEIAGASLPLARDWAGSLSPDKQHTLYTSVQRSFALIGGQKNSLALIGYPRPRVLVMSTVF